MRSAYKPPKIYLCLPIVNVISARDIAIQSKVNGKKEHNLLNEILRSTYINFIDYDIKN